MSTADVHHDAETVLSKISELKLSSLFRFCGEEGQNPIKVAADLVQDIAQLRAPKLGDKPNAFVLQVKNSLQYFCTYPQKAPKLTLVGKPAIKMMTATLMKKGVHNVKVEEIEKPAAFAWLLDPDELKGWIEFKTQSIQQVRATFVSGSVFVFSRAEGEGEGEGNGSLF